MDTQDIYKASSVDGKIIRLPNCQLDRKQYLEVKKGLELIGGKWKGGKTQGFVFEEDPTELLNQLADGVQRNLKKEFQFFATPEELADEMAQHLTNKIYFGDRILEPSAGDGQLVKSFWKTYGEDIEIDCFELMDLNRTKLNKLSDSLKLIGQDFLLCGDRYDWYDYIIANPPFTRNQDILHICKMYQCLKPGGTIVTLSSTSWFRGSQSMQQDFHEFLTYLGADIKEIEPGAFKDSGTMVASLMIIINKPKDKVIDIPDSILLKLKKYNDDNYSSESLQDIPDDIDLTILKEINEDMEDTQSNDYDDIPQQSLDPSPEYIITDLKNSNKKVLKNLNNIESILNNNNKLSNMGFFQQIASLGNADISLRIMQKNDKLTIMATPGSMKSNIQPVTITGTPKELDEHFIEEIIPKLTNLDGIITNIDEVTKEAEAKLEEAKKPKSDKKDKKKETDKKPEQVAEEEPEEDLFS